MGKLVMLCHQGLHSTVAGMVAAQQTNFSATAQHLGAAAQVMHDTAGALQQQTLRLQTELADATTATTKRLRNTHGMAWKCSKVSALLCCLRKLFGYCATCSWHQPCRRQMC